MLNYIISHFNPTSDFNIIENDYGIDGLELMIEIINVIESKSSKELDESISRLHSFICQQIKRSLSEKEKLNILQSINNYVQSEPITDERSKSMEYLFSAKFLINE